MSNNLRCERNVYTMFLRPKLAASYLKRGPKRGQKLAAAYFNRKKLSVYTNVRDLFEPRPIFTRINGPIVTRLIRTMEDDEEEKTSARKKVSHKKRNPQ